MNREKRNDDRGFAHGATDNHTSPPRQQGNLSKGRAVPCLRSGLIWLVFALGVALSHSPAAAQPIGDRDAIEAGRQALRETEDFPWYDAESDVLQRIDVQPPEASSRHRNSTWQPPAPPPPSNAWQYILEVLKWLMYAVGLAILLGLIYLLYRALRHLDAALPGETADDDAEQQRREEDLIESLPFDVKRPRSDLLAEARRQYELGNYGEAVVYLFSYQLVQLDQHHLIRLTRGKTNRQYLREVGRAREIRDMLERTMLAFEDVFFGHHLLPRERFEACWSRLDEFHERLQATP